MPENEKKRIVIDVDCTLAEQKGSDQSYEELQPIGPVVEKLRQYRQEGFYIIIYSARNMRSYQGNTGLLQANTLPVLVDWLKKHDIPYDEIYVGKPWCGYEGFYVDDKAIRPDEFLNMTYEEILTLVGKGVG